MVFAYVSISKVGDVSKFYSRRPKLIGKPQEDDGKW
jgi:hypothetical protein